MIQRLILILSVMTATILAQAQNDNFERRYNLLVSQFGPAGVGVETVLDRWEAADSLNPKVHLARFHYWFEKSKTEEVVVKNESKYLGMKPVLNLKDSTGVDIYYYQESFYDDKMFGEAIKSLDRAIELSPNEIDYRFLKANVYLAYEKGSPDMALAYLMDLVSLSDRKWRYENLDIESDFLADAMQEYCYNFYSLGTTAAMEAFKSLSETMMVLYPQRADFQNNIAAYYLVGKNESKKALKQYSKVLKKFPNDYTALKNCAIITRRDGNRKAEAKYLKQLLTVAPESEKLAIETRLNSIK